MTMPYTVCLNLTEPITGDHIESRIKSSLASLNPQPFIPGSVIAKTTAGDTIYFAENHVAFIPAKSTEALEAVRFALSTAKYVQDESSGRDLKLEFDPNMIYLEIGVRAEKNHVTVGDLKRIGQELQEKLYGGGNFAYNITSFTPTVILGTEEKIDKAPGKKEIVEAKGTAQYVAFLDDLLTIIK